MNTEKNFNKGLTTIETLSASIVDHLLNERKVVIPDLGYLELIVFPNKWAVLFKATDKELFLDSESVIQSSIYDNISVPLKEGKVVFLPDVGIFRTMKNADGSYRVSYTISPALRKILDDKKEGKEEAKNPEAPCIATLEKAEDENLLVVDSESTDEKPEKSEVIKRERKVISVPTYVRNSSKVGDLVVPQERKKWKVEENGGIIAALAIMMILIFVAWYFTLESKNEGNDHTFVSGNNTTILTADQYEKSVDLPSLADRKYGNRIFWVYIYEANRDKISSPVNIPVGTELRIPNLWEDYKVDVMDSMEIKRAGILSDIILKQKI
jgi:hypothetical protein